MALTSLEAIALKLQEKRTTDLENILKVSGSAAVSKNEYGVTVVNEDNVASSLVFKPLVISKLDNVELLKAIDTEVKELKPNIPEVNLNLVPKPLYDDEVIANRDLRKQVEKLTTDIEVLNSEINTLTSKVLSETNKRLSIEQTNDVLANQLDALSKVIEQFATQIQSLIDQFTKGGSTETKTTVSGNVTHDINIKGDGGVSLNNTEFGKKVIESLKDPGIKSEFDKLYGVSNSGLLTK